MAVYKIRQSFQLPRPRLYSQGRCFRMRWNILRVYFLSLFGLRAACFGLLVRPPAAVSLKLRHRKRTVHRNENFDAALDFSSLCYLSE